MRITADTDRICRNNYGSRIIFNRDVCDIPKNTRLYFFFDIDGTIAQNESSASPLLQKAFEILHLRGHKLFLCTGRTICDVYPSLFSKSFSGLICGAGTHIILEGAEILCEKIPDVLLRKVVEQMTVHRASGVLEGVKQMWIIEGDKMLPWDLPRIHSVEEILPGIEAQKFTIHAASKMQCEETINGLENYFHLYPNEDFTFVEAVMRNYSKSTAMRLVVTHYGADTDYAVAFGDSMNDYDIIRDAGIGVAMGNSPKALKEVADIVTGNIDEEGVYIALEAMGMI